MKNKIALILCLTLVVMATFVLTQMFRTFFAASLRGGDSYHTAISKIAGAAWREVERNTINDGRRPMFDYRVVQAKDVIFFGVRGTITMKFYNDNLMAVVFVPKNFIATQQKFMNLVGGKGEMGNFRYNAKVDASCRCIIWRDKSISKSMNEWIRNYA